MEQAKSQLQQYFEMLKPLMRAKPNTGRLWLDIVLLVLLATLQFTILTNFFGQYVIIDLITPWLVIGFIRQPLPYTSALGFIGALMIETHSSAPAGLYISCYWVIAVTVNLTRTAFSWQLLLPWFTTLAVAQVWVIAFETLVLFINTGATSISDPWYILMQVSRLLLSVGIGLWLFRPSAAEIRKESPE